MKIVTTHVYPPIPTRSMDWSAHYDGEEELGHYGWGASEQEAIDDLKENYPAAVMLTRMLTRREVEEMFGRDSDGD